MYNQRLLYFIGEAIMFKVGIICAGDEELKPFLPHLENMHVTEKAMLKIYEGKINIIYLLSYISY